MMEDDWEGDEKLWVQPRQLGRLLTMSVQDEGPTRAGSDANRA
jgi:hypothetical protein